MIYISVKLRNIGNKAIRNRKGLKMKRTIIIDTDNNLVELLQEGYNIIEDTIYDKEILEEAKKLLDRIILDGLPY